MPEERLQPISLHQEMQRSYLEYAMSVIVGRALPDARDGLKPVQRRILFAMHELGLTPDRPYRKCARVVGDVLGKYHPHGDQAVYDALVRQVQDFASRYPLLDGHGNFGSVDDDPPAAMRYTETRLAPIAHETLLEEIGSQTVDFSQNFDGSQQEPTVLPAQLPFLLINGCSGIAVGMATSIPPHNLSEIVDGVIALIKKPNTSDEKLLTLIPGPDFPTGGEILIGSGVKETYLKGRGSIPMRGVTHIEEIQPGKGKHKRTAIIITELPYQLSKAGWIEKLAELVNDSKVIGIADIRDESDREGMRIVVELRRDSDPHEVINDLHRKTSLQNNFGAILLALVNGQPRQLSIRKLLEYFIEFRELTIVRRTKHALKKTEERLETVEALVSALENIKKVIEILEKAKDAEEAKVNLMQQLTINKKQGEAVLSMPLRRLTSLERSQLYTEIKKLKEKKKELLETLNNRDKLLAIMINELKLIKKKYGNPRRSKLIEGGDRLLAEKIASQRPNAELQRKQAYSALPLDGRLLISDDYQVKIISPQLLGRLHLNDNCDLGDEPIPAKLVWPTNKQPSILAISNQGRVALIKWEFAGQNPGTLNNFLPTTLEKETIIDILPIKKEEDLCICLLSNDGRFKRLAIEEILDLSGRASSIVKLKEESILKQAVLCTKKSYIVIATSIGRILKLKVNEKNMPIMGKLAQGSMIIRLLPEEHIIGMISSNQKNPKKVIIITEHGFIQRIAIEKIRTCEKGDMGEMCMTFINRNDSLVEILEETSSTGIISNLGRVGRIIHGDEKEKTQIKLKEKEYINKAVRLITPEIENN